MDGISAVNLSLEAAYRKVNPACIPDKLKPPTGAKVRQALYEEINAHLYDKNARMIAFRVKRERIFLWIRALMIFYEENSLVQTREGSDVSIVVEVTNPDTLSLSYKITFFLSTGTF